MLLQKYYDNKKKYVDNALRQLFVDLNKNKNIRNKMSHMLLKAMKYSTLVGGKRIRSILTLMVDDVLTDNFNTTYDDDILKISLAIELIHTYSLIHDDLPAMDNDDLRRGKLTCHKKFNEATAILAGDALHSYAFYLLASISRKEGLTVIKLISDLISINGMAVGQQMDLYAENKIITLKQLENIHQHKTSALIEISALSPLYLKNDFTYLKAISVYSNNIGLAFQVMDDVLEATSTKEILGKDTSSDIRNNKSTFVSLLGISKARQYVKKLVEKAKDALKPLEGNKNTEYLKAFADFISNRNN